MKKLIAPLLALCLMAGCSSYPKAAEPAADIISDEVADIISEIHEENVYPEIPAADFGVVPYAVAENQDIRVSYPSDIFTHAPEVYPLALYLNESINDDYVSNINVQKSTEFPYDLDKSALDILKPLMTDELTSYGINITVFELRMLSGEPVIYYEGNTTLTDDGIDLLLEQGTLTEEQLEALGGREAAKAALYSYNNVAIMAKVDGYIAIYTGGYRDETHKQFLIDAITDLIENTEIIP